MMTDTFKYNLLNNWSVIRWIRLGLSLIIIGQAIQVHDVLFGLFGSFFLYQALSNTGCCGINGCATNMKNSINQTEEIEFTEVKK